MSPTALRALAPLALMALIFYLSAQQSVGPELPAFTRVIAHFGEYALLAALWVWALRPGARAARALRSRRRSALALRGLRRVSTRASSRAATRTRSTCSSTRPGSPSRCSRQPCQLGEQLRVGVRHPLDRLAVPAHVAVHRDLRAPRAREADAVEVGEREGRVERRQRVVPAVAGVLDPRQVADRLRAAASAGRRTRRRPAPGRAGSSRPARQHEGVGVRLEQARARAARSSSSSSAVGRPRVALDEAEAVVGDDEVERDLPGVAELGDDRLDQPQRLGARRSTRTGSRSSGATGAGSGTSGAS